jgi:hypothetical protein
MSNKILCGTHAETLPAYICKHLLESQEVSLTYYFQAYEVEVDLAEDEVEEPDAGVAWCQACEDIVESAGMWSEDAIAFSDMKVVCEFCFQDHLTHHKFGENR